MLSCYPTKVYFLLLSIAFSLTGFSQDSQPYTFERPLMGSQFLFICYANDSDLASQTAQKAFDRIAELNDILSDYHPESEINQLAQKQKPGTPYKVSDDLWYMLRKAKRISENTNGLFDVTIGNCTKLWRRAKRRKEFPEEAALAHALENTGSTNFELISETQSVVFDKPEIKLDFGGIAKGFAADEAFKIFEAAGLESTMIDAGGDIYCGKAPPGKTAWNVKIISGLGNDTLYASLNYAAIATSGDLYRFLELDGKRYSHIINPLTCMPIAERVATTVISENAEKADFLASVANVAGIGKPIKRIMRNYPKSYVTVFSKNTHKIRKKSYGNRQLKKLITRQ